MRLSGIERLTGRPAVWLAGAIALVIAAGTGSEARQRKVVTAAKAYAQDTPVQQQKPVKLRYFGGPKSVMSPE
jgi:hypothetical protein